MPNVTSGHVTSSSVISGRTPFPNKQKYGKERTGKKGRGKKYRKKNTGTKVRKKKDGGKSTGNKKNGKKVRLDRASSGHVTLSLPVKKVPLGLILRNLRYFHFGYMGFSGTLWSWSYGIWIYNYLCNQCPARLWSYYVVTGTCFIQKICAPSSSLLQGKHLPFSPSPLRLNIFRLFVILSLTQLYRYTPEIFLFSTATFK